MGTCQRSMRTGHNADGLLFAGRRRGSAQSRCMARGARPRARMSEPGSAVGGGMWDATVPRRGSPPTPRTERVGGAGQSIPPGRGEVRARGSPRVGADQSPERPARIWAWRRARPRALPAPPAYAGRWARYDGAPRRTGAPWGWRRQRVGLCVLGLLMTLVPANFSVATSTAVGSSGAGACALRGRAHTTAMPSPRLCAGCACDEHDVAAAPGQVVGGCRHP